MGVRFSLSYIWMFCIIQVDYKVRIFFIFFVRKRLLKFVLKLKMMFLVRFLKLQLGFFYSYLKFLEFYLCVRLRIFYKEDIIFIIFFKN